MKVSIRFATTLCVIALVAALTPVTAGGDSFSLLGSGDNQCWNFKPSERGFARKMNGARALEGLNKLGLDPELSRAARKHTQEMWTQDVLYHTPSDKLRTRVTNWTTIGENVGVGGVVSSLHEAFMNSPAHRDNILYTTYRSVGVGVSKKNGRMWVTVIFESVDNPSTPLSMPHC